MANENYTSMSNQELVDCVANLGLSKLKLNTMLRRHHVELFNEIVNRTKFLDDSCVGENSWRTVPILARLHCLEYGLTKMPICANPDCDNIVFWSKGGSSFPQHCCKRCSNSDPDVIKRIEQVKFDRHGDAHFVNPKKARETNLRVRGVVNPMCLKYVQEKAKATCIKNNGVPYPMQSKKIREKAEQTMVERHGVKHAAQSIDIWERTKRTNIERRGVEYTWQSQEVVEKSIETCIERYRTIHPQQTYDVKRKTENTNIGKYGHKSSFQNEEVRRKQRETCFNTYGVEYYSQTEEYHKRVHKRYTNPKYPDMTFGSSWEFKVYDFLVEHNIPFEYQPAISIPYEYKGTHHTYHPDFRVGDKIVEVKGDNFFRINESIGREEMFCPYRDEDWSDEKYDWMCGLYEAKHQCMLANNVIILRQYQINNLSVDMFIK